MEDSFPAQRTGQSRCGTVVVGGDFALRRQSARYISPSPTSSARSSTTARRSAWRCSSRPTAGPSLGAGGRELLVLVEAARREAGARPHRPLPLRAAAAGARRPRPLARPRRRATACALTGLSDHFVSEAIYLRDPDGHGIEIYWDRPREVWEGQGLRADDDAAARRGRPPRRAARARSRAVRRAARRAPSWATCTSRWRRSRRRSRFYRDVLGFDLMAQLGEQAAFLAAGGYHHHIGANTWESAGASPPPGVRLRCAT